ncbi:MAG TPA: hypothetical protein VIN75_25455 [Burkholderiaceae bacterium]
MPLQDHVRAFADNDAPYMYDGGRQISFGPEMRVGMACHIASFIWLYRAAHAGAFPPLTAFENNAPQHFVDGLIRFGNATRVTMGHGPLPNDVLIFANPDDPYNALHSCVVVANGQRIAGYNQSGWFDNGGVHAYSDHAVDSCDWVARCCCWSTPRRATAAGGQRYVWAVRGATAIGRMA